MAVIVVFTVIFLFIPLAKQDKTQSSLTDVLNAVKNLVSFYKKEYRNFNVDGLYGLRVLEGHTIAIVKKYEAVGLNHLSAQTLRDLTAVKNEVSVVSEEALKYVKQDDKKYFEKLEFVVSTPWDIFEGRMRKVDLSLQWSQDVYSFAKHKVAMDEESSDRCMSELIGSHIPHGTPCNISDSCIFLMTTPGLLGYGITHQLLWTMLAEKAGCRDKLEQRLLESKKPSLSTLRLEFCSNNYIQLISTLKKFNNMIILPAYQDLFLETVFICPSLGFYEFLDLQLLPQIISWQYASGCFGSMKRPSKAMMNGVNLAPVLEASDYDYQDSFKQLISLEEEVSLADPRVASKIDHALGYNMTGRRLLGYNDFTIVKGRQLLVEKSMTGGCLAHKTGVAAGALVIFMRVLCEPNASTLLNNTFAAKLLNTGPSKVSNKLPVPNNNLKFERDPKLLSNKIQNVPDKYHKEAIVDPNEIKPIGPGGRGNVDTQQNLVDKPQFYVNQPENVIHNRVIRHNDPAEINNIRANDIVKPQDKSELGEKLDPVKISKSSTYKGGVPGQVGKPNLKLDMKNLENVQKAVELNMPNDEGAVAADDENDDDGNGNYNEDDDYDYDEDDNNDDGYDDNYNDNKTKHVPLQKDPDYVNKGDIKAGEYKQGNYDGGDDAEDYDHEPKNINGNNNFLNKEVLKGHINSRNIVDKNDFNADNEYADNKRYDDNVRHGKNAHDRYAYDDYRNEDDDDDDDDADEYDYDDKNEHNEKKDSNADIKLESVIHLKDTSNGALQNNINISKDHSVSSSSALFVFAFCFVLLVLLAYRFIKKRRIHFRFGPRISHRV